MSSCSKVFISENITNLSSSPHFLTCAAKSCFNTSTTRPLLNFFPFPHSKELARIWALNAGREDILTKTFNKIKQHVLCADHFEIECFQNGSNKSEFNKNCGPIPTIFENNLKEYLPKKIRLFSVVEKRNSQKNIFRDQIVSYSDMGLNVESGSHFNTTIDSNSDFYDSNSNIEFGNLKYTDDLYNGSASKKQDVKTESDQLTNYELCRLCAQLVTVKKLTPIFNAENSKNFAELLEFCLPGKVFQNDKLPPKICNVCISKLEYCSKILQSFVSAHKKLEKMNHSFADNNNCRVKSNTEDVTNQNIYLSSSKSVKLNDESMEEPKLHQQTEESSEGKNQLQIKYECLICNALFSNKHDVINHSLNLHSIPKQGKIVCRIVRAKINSTTSSTRAKVHVPEKQRSNNNQIKYECLVCSSLHEKKETLISHTLRYHPLSKGRFMCRVFRGRNMKQVKCLRCKRVFNNIKKYRQHMREHLTFTCVDCGSAFNRIYKLVRHQKSHKVYTCLECNEKFCDKSDFGMHELGHKRILEDVVCQQCNKPFTSNYSLRKHQKIHESYLCDICGKSYPTLKYLTKHLSVHSNERPFKCDVCLKTFKNSQSFKRHNFTHDANKNFVCQICGKQFRTEAVLNQHILTHSKVKQYLCDFCGVGFHRRSNFLKHRKIHASVTDDDYYVCGTCNKFFVTKTALHEHRIQHGADKKVYSCRICLNRFTSKLQLMVHARIHTGERPFKCDFCEKSFRSKASLMQHRLIHLDIFPHQCTVCDRKFKRLQSLIVHRKTHTGERPFSCSTCGRAFANRGDMLKHWRTHLNKSEKVVRSDKNGEPFDDNCARKVLVEMVEGEIFDTFPLPEKLSGLK